MALPLGVSAANSAHAMPAPNALSAASFMAPGSVPSASCTTKYLAPAALVEAASSSTALIAASLAAPIASFASAVIFLVITTISSRISARSTAGITAVSTMPLSVAISCASSGPLRASHALTRAATSAAVASAARAAPLVAPTMRRMPFATPSSDISTNSSASAVLPRWVPPQNSMENPFQSSLPGDASRSSILAPTLTTRTGSGYTSPNTARSPLMALAFARGTSRVSTASLRAICVRTMASAALTSSMLIALLCEKSKRSFSSSTRLPFWFTSSPSTVRSAKLSTCVSVWLGMTLPRRS
mmetsp:Transcript_36931/g.91247  ORF Transcript_36931/g.91247 Transcript_36931/m.91247 type:complete len:301 (+) Transcript_36931:740-1642(+)